MRCPSAVVGHVENAFEAAVFVPGGRMDYSLRRTVGSFTSTRLSNLAIIRHGLWCSAVQSWYALVLAWSLATGHT